MWNSILLVLVVLTPLKVFPAEIGKFTSAVRFTDGRITYADVAEPSWLNPRTWAFWMVSVWASPPRVVNATLVPLARART